MFFFVFVFFFFVFFFFYDGPFRPSDQDRVHFGTPAFSSDRPRHSARAQRGVTMKFKLVGWDEHQAVSRVPWLTILHPKTQNMVCQNEELGRLE